MNYFKNFGVNYNLLFTQKLSNIDVGYQYTCVSPIFCIKNNSIPLFFIYRMNQINGLINIFRQNAIGQKNRKVKARLKKNCENITRLFVKESKKKEKNNNIVTEKKLQEDRMQKLQE